VGDRDRCIFPYSWGYYRWMGLSKKTVANSNHSARHEATRRIGDCSGALRTQTHTTVGGPVGESHPRWFGCPTRSGTPCGVLASWGAWSGGGRCARPPADPLGPLPGSVVPGASSWRAKRRGVAAGLWRRTSRFVGPVVATSSASSRDCAVTSGVKHSEARTTPRTLCPW
jgi:hypothetical protein